MMLYANKSAAFAQTKGHGASCPCCRSAAVPKAVVSTRRVARSSAVTVKAQAAATTVVAPAPVAVSNGSAPASFPDMKERHAAVAKHFPSAVGVDDLIGRVELALASFGFTGDNTIGMTNLCRDEVTAVLKDKIDAVFGASFNTNGLGGVLTCGVTGMKAGLSHSPVCNGGRERYVFFSFPHIAINSKGEVGAITRPGRPKQSCACGALLKCLGELKTEGVEVSCKVPGVHDPLEPEYSILKQRLARRARYERMDVSKLDLPSLTALAERTITGDLEYLIDKAVDTKMSDYAVITGVQIHNWADELVPGGEHSLEFVAPTKAYVVCNGQKTYIDLQQVPSLSPRQLQLAASKSLGETVPEVVEPGLYGSVMSEVPLGYLVKKLGGAVNAQYGAAQLSYSNSDANPSRPTWATKTMSEFAPKNMPHLDRDPNAPTMDTLEPAVATSFEKAA